MGDFKVKFDHAISYFDPVYTSLRLNVIGEAEVSCAREGDEGDVRWVSDLIAVPLMDELSRLSSQQISYRDIIPHMDSISRSVSLALAPKGIMLNAFTISGISPDALSKSSIELHDRMNASKSMTPADYTKQIEETQKKVQQSLDSINILPPEERRKQEEVRRIAELQMAQIQQNPELAKAVKDADDAAAAAGAAALKSVFAPPKKRYCSKCGNPLGNGKFCGKCGNQVR